MSRTFLVIAGWVRDEHFFKKLQESAPNDISFLFLDQKLIKNTESIKEYLTKNSLSKIYLIGQSAGGARAIEFTAKYLNIVNKLFLIDSEGIYGNEKIAKFISNLFIGNLHHGLKKLKTNVRSIILFLKNPLHSAETAKYAHYVDLAAEMKLIKCPTIIIWGEHDRVTPLWQGKTMSKLIPNSKLVILKNMDHDWIIHNGEMFWQNIEETK